MGSQRVRHDSTETELIYKITNKDQHKEVHLIFYKKNPLPMEFSRQEYWSHFLLQKYNKKDKYNLNGKENPWLPKAADGR